MTIIPVFRDINQPPEPWTADICDLVREKWFIGIPRNLRVGAANTGKPKRQGAGSSPIFNGTLGGAVRAEKTAKERAELAVKLRPLLEQGIPLYRAAQQLGMTWARAKKIAVENGMEPPADLASRSALNGIKRLTRADRDILAARAKRIQQMISRGQTNRQICDALEISPRSLDRTIKKYSLKLGCKRKAENVQERNGQIIDLYRQGYTHEDIAARFGLAKNTVQKIVRGAA